MTKVTDIIEWQEHGSDCKLYVKHYHDAQGKFCLQIVFEDTTHEKVTEINIPSHKVKQFLYTVNGDLLNRKYEINT